ncbi:hypothetical protein B0I31_102182 [Saccharothrix carnea]|uniref:Uncharacterized protein n=1 Tax=Saccharothrix carnea TaxID=1280637 RepID=A0A2P8IFH2_SACCR|nr:hypothetical protein [Saccharothrix carnea]PSL57204.1 hypothetical protein B0I31_102182 [Saccharothrix carnea]
MVQEARVDVKTTAPENVQELSNADLAAIAGSVTPGPWFATEFRTGETRREADDTWELLSTTPKAPGGTAAVYYADGHSRLTRPMIFADGFNYGPSDLPGLFEHLNSPYNADGGRFLSQVLAAGIDVVLLGFDQRHADIRTNAGVAINCIRRAIAQCDDDDVSLIVGGVSMGGMVTRYALASMEADEENHHTGTYLSYDTPHNGAWIPLILQQLAYFFEELPVGDPDAPTQAALIRSAAAQQLLWSWVPNALYSGPTATASTMRTEFLDDLRKIGWFPKRPRTLGVANGAGDGIGRDLPPGTIAFDWKAGVLASATARFQPDNGAEQAIGGMNFGTRIRRPFTSAVPALDGAPGGILESFGLVADKLNITIGEEYRSSCFVPVVSALALDFDPVKWDIDPYVPLEEVRAEQSRLDEFQWDNGNTPHGVITEPLARWILSRITV